MRLDVYLYSEGLAKSRSRAASLIAGGFVTVNGVAVTKASYAVEDNDSIAVTGEEHPFVGRGGMKLDAALEQFGIDVTGLVCADIGASTGGFTDCLLRRGAAHVYAVDSGHDQLDESLKNDSRVTNMENCNARYLTKELLGRVCDCAVADLSFISQTLILPAVSSVLSENGQYIALIKPQFECGRTAIGKGGIVKDPKQHREAVRQVLTAANANGLAPQKLMKSPIQGGDGNTEFLFWAAKGKINLVTENDIAEAVKNK
ncbi:MAG: TlyA family RNA methyltransferase [Clostridia bacterium]|nr:TlyA family RNA methyltransferase [Clostridia bacterium]